LPRACPTTKRSAIARLRAVEAEDRRVAVVLAYLQAAQPGGERL
jgi:hypothetical protein